jgi:YbbR domain-containing protein
MDFLRRFVFHNFALKLLSLASAVLLWSAVAREPVSEVAHTVPIEFQHVPEDLAINSDAPLEAQVWMRGPQRVVREVRAFDLHLTIDVAKLRNVPGEPTVELTPSEIKAPHGVEIVQVVPSEVHLRFDRRVTREVMVRPRVTANLPAGRQIARIIAEPSAVYVVGPQGRVNALESVLTDAVDASGVAGRATFTTNAYAPDPMVRLARPTIVRVTVITEKTSARAGEVK